MKRNLGIRQTNSDLQSENDSDGSSVTNDDDQLKTMTATPDNLVALDCEMVGVGPLKRNALARCSIVDYHGKVLYDRYIKPKEKITDYRTRWSGILPHHMKIAISFKAARKQILDIIKNKIIVGHSLHFDFKILKINRSSRIVRDTSMNVLLREMAGFPPNQTASLRRLTRAVLGRDIQGDIHCSIEDSIAAMDLYRAVENDWETDKRTSKYLSDVFWPEWIECSS